MKTVLFIMPDLPSGGAEKLLIDILKRLDREVLRIALLLEYKQGTYLDDIPEDVELITLHGPDNKWRQRLHRVLEMFGLYNSFHSLIYKRQLRTLLKDRHFNTIVSFMEGSALKLHTYIVDKAERNVSWVHIDFRIKHWSLAFFKDIQDETRAYNLMDEIVFVSNEAKERFKEIMDKVSSKLCVQYNLIDGKEINRIADTLNVQTETKTICMCGRLNRQKRYDRALTAVKILVDKGHDFRLWILGEGELEDELKLMCKNMNLDNYVGFLGFKKPAYSYVKAADIFLNTSESEGYPLTICEAICMGKAIVATAITGSTEILKASECGILVDETPESIAEGLEMLLNNEEEKRQHELKALKGACQFNVTQVMNNIQNILVQ